MIEQQGGRMKYVEGNFDCILARMRRAARSIARAWMAEKAGITL